MDIKSEVKDLIEQETDVTVLKAIKTLLESKGPDSILKKKLTRRALAAEDDIRNDRTLSKEQVLDQIHQHFNK